MYYIKFFKFLCIREQERKRIDNSCKNTPLGSDCSSEVSSVCTSMPSTSQIENNVNKLPDNKKNLNNHLNIDTRQLYDPDSLWRRNKYRYFIY